MRNYSMKNDPRKCTLLFKPKHNGIDLQINSECESWNSPNGEWVKVASGQ